MKHKVESSSSEDEEDLSRFASVAVDGTTVVTNAVGLPRANYSDPSRLQSSECADIIGKKSLEIALEKRMDAIWASTYLWTEEETKAGSQHLTDQGKQSEKGAMGMKLFRGGPYLSRSHTLGDVPAGGRSRHVSRKIQRRQVDKPRKPFLFDLSLSDVAVTAEEIQQCHENSLEISYPFIGRQNVGKAKMRRLMRNARLYGHSLNCDE